MATTTNYSWTTPDDTDLVKDGAAAIRTLGSSADTTVKDLNPGTTAGDIDYYTSSTAKARVAIGTAGQVLKVNGGGTAPEWATTADQTPLTTKGDLFTFDTADARIGVGADGTVLTAASGEATGLQWAAPAAGGSMTLLSTTTLTGAATITISSISQSYTNLYILITGLNVTTGTYTLKLRPDSSDANNYSNLRGGTVAESNPNYISPGNAGHSASSAVNDYALMIFNYTDTVNTKPFFMVGIAKMASQIEPLGVSALGATNVASAIDSFQLSNDSGGNFTAGTVKIYGVN
jgi:hypothetical protein